MPHRTQSAAAPVAATQPKTYKLTIAALLMLPFRICNPPPAVGKIRSCGVVPLFDVSLDDILDRRHLPPLGLKDFEEWLIYVELAPENLYFILWLREYTVRYHQWAAISKAKHDAQDTGREWEIHNSPQLALFYARAKQTFFTPNSTYELNLPSNILAPFHVPNNPSHPDPSVFDQVALETRYMLKDSLRRFVTAQFNNVGNKRVLCGIIAGTIFCILGALLPLVYNFATGRSRWERITALPGLWLGVTVLVSSLNGICLGVYVFGDLRQLRKFELSRPPISKPTPLYSSRLRQRPVISSPLRTDTDAPDSMTAISHSFVVPPPPTYTRSHISGRTSMRLDSSASTMSSLSISTSDEGSATGTNSIHISPAYYDADPIEGPATSPVDLYSHTAGKSRFDHFDDDGDDDDATNFPVTAAFIHAFDPKATDTISVVAIGEPQYAGPLPEELQLVSSFDFDALPHIPLARCREKASMDARPSNIENITPSLKSSLGPQMLIIEPEAQAVPSGDFTLKGFIQRMQNKCNINRWFVITAGEPETQQDKKKPSRDALWTEAQVQKQFKIIRAVPAFASPLTKVLNPVVVRGQWEIVIRSMIIACFVSWVVLGLLLAIPPRHLRV